MAEPSAPSSSTIGLKGDTRTGGVSGALLIAGLATLVWLALCSILLFRGDVESADRVQLAVIMVLMVVPVGLIWTIAATMRARAATRADILALRTSLDALRKAQVAQAQPDQMGALQMITRRLDDIAANQRKADTALAMMGSIRMAETQAHPAAATPTKPAAESSEADQPALALGTPAEDLEPPLSNADFIRAMNFPDTAEDQEGFAALRNALKHRAAAQLIRASQDVLTLLSQENIYVDDLRPDLARPEIWRRFAKGERGRGVAALGGVRDRSSLALTSGRMKTDPVFRDAAHHFLRKFDQTFAAFEEEATDSELTDFANTRTARAFMLVGRVARTFD